MRRISSSSGFTVPEMIIVLVVSGAMATMIFGPLNDLYRSNISSGKKIIQTADVRGGLRTMENDITYSTAFLTTKATDVTDSQGIAWSINGTGTAKAELITGNYATTASETPDTPNPTRNLVFDGSASTTTLRNNTVYFINNGVLYRRVLKNNKTPYAGAVIAQKGTCPVASATAACPADGVIMRNVSAIAISYYGSPSDTTPQATPAGATTVQITLTASQGVGAQNITNTSKVRISPVNIGATP